MKKHFWRGQIITDEQLESKLANLEKEKNSFYSDSISWDQLLYSLEKFGAALQLDEKINSYLISLGQTQTEIKDLLLEIAKFCSRDNILSKWKKELGDDQAPFDFKRVDFTRNLFEAWKPLGILTHILPGNAFGLSILATIEGLISGNFNIVKLSSKENNFALVVFELLAQVDSKLAEKIIVLKMSSQEVSRLDSILAISDGVSAWGGDGAIQSIRDRLPAQTRFIPWGHKISMAMISQKGQNLTESLKNLASDIVLMEQQACSSPQIAFVEVENFVELVSFGKSFLPLLEKESLRTSQSELSLQEQAEITNQVELAKLESLYGNCEVLTTEDGHARIIIEDQEGLRPSPLYRTIIFRPIKRNTILSTLSSWRKYLQSVSLICSASEEMELASQFIQAGVTRVALPGQMLGSYQGEPHDGVDALPRFMRKNRIELSHAEGIFRPESMITEEYKPVIPSTEVMTKKGFQDQNGDKEVTRYYFKSGGSSGKSALSPFSYRDYHHQMQAAAEGLFAAGFQPATDRAVNLFFGGGLYGGFLSFTTILEKIDAVQLPMSAHEDLAFVAEMIIKLEVNTLLGMPSYIIQLLTQQKEVFKKYSGITKIFYGGEHFSPAQREWLENEFSISLIKSASYGSVDAGPLGYQCLFSSGGIHHLNDQLHTLEILEMDQDQKISGFEVGRLIFTTKHRDALDVIRYEIGDVGRWVHDQCQCGRRSPRFELMGRMGDVFRAAGTFINLQKIEKILRDNFNYQGESQVVLEQKNNKDSLTLYLDSQFDLVIKDIFDSIIENYTDLREVVFKEKALDFSINAISNSALLRTESSGKLRRVVDQRNRS